MQTVLGKMPWPNVLLVVLLVVLNACTGRPVKEFAQGNEAGYQQRVEKLASIDTWGFVGRLSLDDGEQGGSGRLQWDVKSNISDLDFHGAMGRGAWHLRITPKVAVLTEADGSLQTAADVNDLIQDRMGWPIPVDALHWWVRGLAAPGIVEHEVLDQDGLLLSLEQFGWSVDFNRYNSIAGTAMPTRLDAGKGSFRVKLAIGRWLLDTGGKE
jgi:outer membrane lipoprotein LolB